MKHLTSKPVLTDSELLQALSKFNRQTCLAILLTLTLDITPEEVIKLTWNEIKNISLNKAAIKILNSLPRHIFSDLVFWNNIHGTIKPLHNFSDSITLLIGNNSLNQYRVLFKNIVYVENSSKQFIRAMSKSAFERT